ncbi:hypothetical protein BG005_000557 [Podila minutissima]|nr:hypothetical protein BG005_000557 [Podila minutissima]
MYKSNRQSENELEPGEDSTRLHQNEQVEMEKFARDDCQKVTAASIYSRLGKDCVDSIYHVYFQFDKKRSDDQTVLTLKWCHGEISGMMKDIVQLVEAQPEKFQALRDQIQQVIILGRGEVLDPEVCAKKG